MASNKSFTNIHQIVSITFHFSFTYCTCRYKTGIFQNCQRTVKIIIPQISLCLHVNELLA